MLAYRGENNLIHQLHPCTMVAYVAAVAILALLFSHPFYLFGLFAAVGLVMIAADNWREWKPYLLMSLYMIAVILVTNALFVRAGSTVLFAKTRLLGLDRLGITLEALCFGLGMGLRLVVIISAFCLYTYSINPDKVMKLFSRWGNKTVLAITLATRLLPLMAFDLRRITDVQRCRGVKIGTGGIWQRTRSLFPIICVLFLSSLERSWQMAEAMQVRGYGSGPRTHYSRELWRPRDVLVLSAVILGFAVGVIAGIKGWSTYNYYPALEKIVSKELIPAIMIMLLLSSPAMISWGWDKWPKLRSKI